MCVCIYKYTHTHIYIYTYMYVDPSFAHPPSRWIRTLVG